MCREVSGNGTFLFGVRPVFPGILTVLSSQRVCAAQQQLTLSQSESGDFVLVGQHVSRKMKCGRHVVWGNDRSALFWKD